MSFAAETWAWDQSCGDGVAKSVLAYLSFRADRHTAEAWPAIATIVKAVEHTERSVRKALAKLVKAGKVEREQRYAANGRCISTLYRLPVASAPAEAVPTPANEQETTPANKQEKPSVLNHQKEREERESTSPQAAPPAPAPLRDEKVALKEAEAPRPKRPQRTPLPDNWTPSREERQLAREAGFSEADIGCMAETFRDWASEKGAHSCDWSASWRKWVRREPKFRAKGSQRRSRPTGDDIKAVMAKYRAPYAFTGATIEGVAL